MQAASAPQQQGKAPVQSTKGEDLTSETKILRCVDAIRAATHLQHVPEGFPQGPIPGDKNMLLSTVNRYTTNITNAEPFCGAFHVTLSRPRECITKGTNRSLICTHRSRERGVIGCNWAVTYEESSQGWVLVNYKRATVPNEPNPENHHNHTLLKTTAEVMSKKMGRHIPPDAVEFGRVMASTGFGTSEVDRAMRRFVKDRGIEPSWKVEDVREEFRAHQVEKQLDATNLFEYLEAQKRDKGLQFYQRLDGDRLDRVFWELEGGLREWARGGDSNVLLFDPTWGTNMYGLKLACFTTVASTGRTVIIACVLFRNEDHPTFEWCFSCFAQTFVTKPSVLFTDHDPAIQRAYETLSAFDSDPWYDTKHFLCVFHISKNLSKHLKPLFADNSQWHHVNHLFWRIAKESDWQTVDNWDEEWKGLVDFVENNGKSDASDSSGKRDKKTNALKWLRTLEDDKEKWAARFVFAVCTFGIHSTQRSESTNAALKGYFIRGRMLMTEVTRNVDEYNKQSRDRHAVDAHLLKVRNAKTSAASTAAVRSLEDKLTPYAMSLVLQQESLVLQYHVISRDDKDENEDYPDPPEGRVEEDDNFVYVTRHQLPEVVRQPCLYDDADEPHSFNIPTDFGLADAPNGATPLKYRITTLTSCSCQFPMAFGGLPCRHILAACMWDKVTEYPTDDIASKWLRMDVEEENHLHEALVHDAEAKAPKPPRPSGSLASTLTRPERYRVLLSSARDVAEKACETAESFKETKELLRTLTLRLRSGMSLGGAWLPIEEEEEDDGDEQEAAPAAEHVVEDNEMHQTISTAHLKDDQDWNASMGITRQPVMALSKKEPEDYISSTIMIKYNNKRRGEWYAGRVTSYDEESGHHEIHFEVDHQVEWHYLEDAKYTSTPSATKWSWVLLEPRPLSDELDASTVRPPAGGSIGRPRSKRFAPAPGHPTSHGWHKNKGLSPMKASRKGKKASHKG